MDKLRVLILVDVWGWAFDFVARGIQKHSRNFVVVKRWNEVVEEDARIYDCLFSMNDSCWFAMGDKRQKWFDRFENKCVGIRGEEMPCDRILEGWTIAAVSQRIYDGLTSENLPVKNVYLCRNGVDTGIFKPTNRTNRQNRLVVGWAGNPTQQLKRFHLLTRINKSQFSLLTMTKWGPQFFHKGRDRQDMINFYPKLDTFINVSIHEGMPQTVLEAAATKLPMVVTDVGGMPEFVDSEWVIPVNPEDVLVGELNRKLQILKDDYGLRRKIGERNYRKVVREWSWENRARDYDDMFEGK